ncbi:adenylate cyclase, putative [Eimeria praecox]|uniref:Adenylate cyclase, putative n=1 Tax=Eimeria praecox TaxID=51316 RepID=U6G324_9EIME|nr:adenylate cyclase, putative [Eimeria praecox]
MDCMHCCRYSDDFDVQVETFTAAVVFCDASGFTALTEALDTQPNGAERLGGIINQFFDKIIRIVHFWGGDIIKFSGDALTVVWPVDDEEEGDYQLNGADDSEYRVDARQACLLAAKCCMNLHQSLHKYPTGFAGKTLTLHIGAGFGRVTILQVGGIMDRWEYVVAGAPLEEISIAEPLASTGKRETVVSPTMADAMHGVATLEPVKDSPPGRQFYRLLPKADDLVKIAHERRQGTHLSSEEGAPNGQAEEEELERIHKLADWKVDPPPPLAPIEVDADDVDLLRRYIPPAVFRRLKSGCNVFLNELRTVSVMFICVRGLDVSSTTGSQIAHKLMKMTQKAAYTMEGSVNKFLVDDKGVLLLVMFGLPPVYHLDDPVRAIMAGLRVIDGMKMFGLDAGIGITSGRVWCGTVGNDLRKEYTALGDFVNLSARLMAKAGPREIYCDANTHRSAQHAMEFKQLPSMKVKGKEHPIEVFMPTGTLINTAQTGPELGPLLSWPGWPCRNQLQSILEPSTMYKKQGKAVRPPLDYPVPCGPVFAHEWYEPYMPQLQPLLEVGGVMVIKGREGLGAKELEDYIRDFGSKKSNRQMFCISNMPDSPNLNIGNVPLLAWRKLCTEMVERWRVSDNREKKGYSRIDRDNSVYGLTKELIHPSFHWRLEEMKTVVHGLVLPYELPENKRLAKERRKCMKQLRKQAYSGSTVHSGDGLTVSVLPVRRLEEMKTVVHGLVLPYELPENKRLAKERRKCMKQLRKQGYVPMSPTMALLHRPAEWVEEAGRRLTPVHALVKNIGVDLGLAEADSDDSQTSDSEGSTPRYLYGPSGESIAPIIASLVNGFSLFESSIVVLHVRTGTSVFAEMDRDSWRVARLVARVSLVRRQHRLDDDMRSLKEWRCKHSRKCWWCKGYRTATVVDSSGKVNPVHSTSLCKPLPSQFYQPLVFVLICSDTTDSVPEQQQLVQMAKDNNAYIELRIPKYIFLTAKQLVKDGHVVLKERRRKTRGADDLLRENTRNFELRYRRLLLQRMGKQYQDLQQEYETPREKAASQGSCQEGSQGPSPSDDSSDEDDTEVRYVDDEVIVAVIGLLKTLNKQRMDLGLEPDEVFIPPSSADAEQADWRQQVQYDGLSPSCMPPDAAALELMPPPASSLLSAVSFSLEEDADGEPVRSPFYLAECFRRRLLDWEPKDSTKAGEHDRMDSRDSATVNEEPQLARRFASRRRGRKVNGLGGTSSHCRVGLQEHLAQEDRRRIRRGKLTDAEFALLCFRPSWMPLDFEDLAALRRSRRRRVAQAKNLEWDSDADEPIVKQGDAEDGGWGIKRYSEARVVSNLNSLPFVPQLVADCMFTVERLLPEEQMMAKVASVFPIAFRPTELRMAYPRRMLSKDFYNLVYQLIVKDVLEVCEPASQEEQEALSHFIGSPTAKTTAQHTVTTVTVTPPDAAGGTAHGKSAVLLEVPGGGTGTQAAQSNTLEHTPFPGLGPGHERRPSVMKAGGIVTPAKVAAAGSQKGSQEQGQSAHDSSTKQQQNSFEADLAGGHAAGAAWTSVLATPEGKEVHIRFTSIALQRHTVTTVTVTPPDAAGGTAQGKSAVLLEVPGGGTGTQASQSNTLEHTPFPGLGPGHERRPSVMKAGGIVTPAKVAAAGSQKGSQEQGQSAHDSSTKQQQNSFEADLAGGHAAGAAWTSVLATPEGKEVHIRFTSIALQRVVSDLLLSDERKWLTLVCRRALAQRFVTLTESQNNEIESSKSVLQATASSGSPVHEAPEAEDAIPESLLEGVLEAERNQKMQTDRRILKVPVMSTSETQLKEAESTNNPPAASVEGADSTDLAYDRTPESG